jgi:hypothetical protein
MTHEIPARLLRFEDSLIAAAKADLRKARRRQLALLVLATVLVIAGAGFGATALYPDSTPTVAAPLEDPVVVAKVASLAKALNDCMVAHGVVITKDRFGNLDSPTPQVTQRKALKACDAEQRAGLAYEQTPAYLAANSAAAAKAMLVWACVARKGFTPDRMAATNYPPPEYFAAFDACKRDPYS